MLLNGVHLHAQTVITVKGTVTDSQGMVLPGASILEKGTTNGATSDFDGNYMIDVPSNSVLVFSYVGYKTQEASVSNKTFINIELEEDAATLDEVVVVGYGTAKKSDLTGAVSSVSSKDFEKQPVFRVEDALQGRASGVIVNKNSGAPGSEIKIRIRGSNSINGNNQPLVVIDGVIGADLRSINTNDVASMEVLKDASATAIYGSRGANGVILVTTKRGSGVASIHVDAFTAISSISKHLDILSAEEFGAINNLPVIDGGTDYQDRYFRTGYTQNVQVSLSGKSDNIGYFVSGNLVDQSGTSINSNYKRYSLRANLDAKMSDKLSVGLNLYGSSEETLNLISGGSASSPDDRAGIIAVLGWDPTLPVKGADGNYNLSSPNGSGLINPIAERLESEANGTINSLNANLNLSYDITENLNLTIVGGLLYNNSLSEIYRGVPSGTVLSNPTGSASTSYNTTLQNSNILTWSNTYDKHNIKVTGLFEIQNFVRKGFNANAGEYTIPANFYSLELGTAPLVSANLSKSTIHSYMGRAEYNFDQKLYLTGTLRADTSSRFRPGNQTGYFPSGSLAYQFRDIFDGAVQRLKLRAGYGEVGNQAIAPYSTYNTLLTGQNYPLDGSSETRGVSLGTIANPDLTWETTKQSNIGFDVSFFDRKVNFSANKYWKNTTDLLLEVPLPDFTGGGAVLSNVGEIFNGGWEFDLETVLAGTEKFNWSANLNYSYNKSEVKSLTAGQQEILLSPIGGTSAGGIANTTGAYVRLKVGEPLGQFYGATFLGTYKTGETGGNPGEAKYLKDDEGNLILGVIGNGIPKHTWALNNTVEFGDFDLNILIRGVHGYDVFNFTRGKISMPGGVQSLATYGEYRNRWTPQNETDIPSSGDLFVNSTRFLEKGDFVRLSNLAVGYNLKVNKYLKSIRFYASAQNLFTLTDYKGYDPEASSIGATEGASASLDYGANPNSRTYTLGLKIGF
ncbi:TonB-dependent receptor [Aestuariibaculum suncheonense]